MNFAAFDLNLLRVFDAMMVEHNTTRAGARVGLSQPAVSSALRRLRDVTGDDLFVRSGNKMVPTAGAKAMHIPVGSALRQLEETLSSAIRFHPSEAQRSFVIIGSDYFSSLLVPGLTNMFTKLAPRAVLKSLDLPAEHAFEYLKNGKADVFLDKDVTTSDWIDSQVVARFYFLCVARRNHPRLKENGVVPGERIPPDLYCSIPQIIRSIDGGTIGTMDPTLRLHGLGRRVAMTSPHFKGVVTAAASTDFIGNVPGHFAYSTASYLDLDIYLPPFDPPLLDIRMYWHRRLNNEPANRWFRGVVSRNLDPRHEPPCPRHPRTDGLDWIPPLEIQDSLPVAATRLQANCELQPRR